MANDQGYDINPDTDTRSDEAKRRGQGDGMTGDSAGDVYGYPEEGELE